MLVEMEEVEVDMQVVVVVMVVEVQRWAILEVLKVHHQEYLQNKTLNINLILLNFSKTLTSSSSIIIINDLSLISLILHLTSSLIHMV